MEKTTISTHENTDKNFIAQLMTIIEEQNDKVDAQYLCSAPSSAATSIKNFKAEQTL